MFETIIAIIFGIIAVLLVLLLLIVIVTVIVDVFITIYESIQEYKRERKKKMKQCPIHPCIGCIYFKACGETNRTMPCEGRLTKSEKKKIAKGERYV